MKKVLLIRLDKIGDLISTLPVDQLAILESSQTEWVLSRGLGFIAEHSVPKRKYLELDRKQAWESFIQLFQYLKANKPDIAVSFQAPWWVSLALFLAQIPTRAGVQSQWHSFLFLNKTLRQKRSQARQHEAEYNSDLLAFAMDHLEKRLMNNKTSPILNLKAKNKFDLGEKDFIVVHPGMAGSALNWPIKKYIELISSLIKDHKVVLTGTNNDEKWLSDIKKTFAENPQVINLQEKLNPSQLLDLLAKAKAVICPSTGVAHMAASLGTPVISLFSPIQVQAPVRWRPRGQNVKVLAPEVSCPEQFTCAGESCKYFFCMDKISVESVLQEVRSLE